MASEETHLSPQRLFDAAEAALTAIMQAPHAARERPHPPALMGTLRQPRCLDEFARWEIEEATAFLIRLGILESPRAAA